jgi:hypothetical protein
MTSPLYFWWQNSSGILNQEMSWNKNLKQAGQYLTGYVDDLQTVLELHKIDTVSTFGMRTSRKSSIAINIKQLDATDDINSKVQTEKKKILINIP